MRRLMGFALVLAVIGLAWLTGDAVRGPLRAQGAQGPEHKATKHYRRTAPKVRGYVARRGGYSYAPEDSINTYGDSRSKFGSTSFYRDPRLDSQTNGGPFDHGFFFDSGINPRGGNSPYPN